MNVDSKYKNNIKYSVVVKGLSFALSLYAVNVYLGYLGDFQYGLWLTISSVASWIAMGDLGIGNGLRNELAKAYAEGDQNKQNGLIESSIITFIKLSLVLFCVLLVISEFLMRWGMIDSSLRVPMYITIIFACINLVLGVFSSVANAFQYGYLSSASAVVSMIFSVGIVYIFTVGRFLPNLTAFAIVYGGAQVLSNAILIIVLKHRIGFNICFSQKTDNSLIKAIIHTGIRFFVLQICCLILYSTDNVIINYLFGADEVTRYGIISKIYEAGDSLFSILLVSLWSAVTYQYSLGNIRWIKEKARNLLFFWFIYSMGVIIVSVLFNQIVYIWLGNKSMHFDVLIISVFAIYNIIGAFGSIFVNIANGIGIIKLQMIMSVCEAIINIPLSLFLAKCAGLGITGVKIATFLCCTGANFVMPIYVIRYLNSHIYLQEDEK